MDPVLILQMQRMGDLALSFPLASRLLGQNPERPVWVVGEPLFYQGLVEISPPITYFAYAEAKALTARRYSLIINLSHRREAAALSSSLQAEKRLGPYLDHRGWLRVSGAWQLYRASLSHNNRHNLFHWADLNSLDIFPASFLWRTLWPQPQRPPAAGQDRSAGKTRVGLFVGASEAGKRPDAKFWAGLAARLLRMGARPALLGGEGDKKLAAEVAALLRAPSINLCGRFSLSQLCRFFRRLDLLITPDTGPMHLAAWLGTPILNISLGPVNAWETGPFAPGHHVLLPALSCAGCWTCIHSQERCKALLSAEKVSVIARLLLEKDAARLQAMDTAGGRLLESRRDRWGLSHLEALNGYAPPRLQRSLYWKHFFGIELGALPPEAGAERERLGARLCADLKEKPLQAGSLLLRALRASVRARDHAPLHDENFWLSCPPFLRPLGSYAQFLLQNDDFSPAALEQALALTQGFIKDMRGG